MASSDSVNNASKVVNPTSVDAVQQQPQISSSTSTNAKLAAQAAQQNQLPPIPPENRTKRARTMNKLDNMV